MPRPPVLAATPEAIARAAAVLRDGGLVGVPTETVYGLAADLRREDALARVFAAKARPRFDPLIVHVPAPPAPALGALEAVGLVRAAALPPAARRSFEALAGRFWPGPLTLVLPRGPAVPDLVTAGLPTVALRAPAHPAARALLDALGAPFAAPSANPFGGVSPTTAAHVAAGLDGAVDLVLDGGPARVGVESTVARVEADGGLALLRPGGVPAEALRAVAPVRPAPAHLDVGAGAQASPGRLASHYAPGAPVRVFDAAPDDATLIARLRALAPPPGSAVLLLAPPSPARAAAVRGAVHPGALASLGATPEARARGLFATLRTLDAGGPPCLVAERPAAGATGLDHAIRDRLTRAAGSRG